MRNRILVALVAAAAVGGCGADDSSDPASPPPSAAWPSEPRPEPGFDPDDPALEMIPEDDAARRALIKRVGNREDFKVPRDVLAGRKEGPLVLASS